MPYANQGHIAEKWLHENMPIIHDVTMMGLLEQRSYAFVVSLEHDKLSEDWNFDRLPAPFSYPYSTNHTWNSQSEYSAMLRNNKGHQFFPRTSFDNINELLAVLSQSQVQDVMWVEAEAQKMRNTKLSAYFTPTTGEKEEKTEVYYEILALPPEYRTTFESAWRRLAKEGTLKILLHSSCQDSAGYGNAFIVDTPSAKYDLEEHLTEDHELVLTPMRSTAPYKYRINGPDFKVCGFKGRSTANNALNISKGNGIVFL
ncbi:hypothetical protein J3459_018280 [Metarhizium acridum]|nr:hypothetical protein J3459_018280 [Metarhizium acridum]